MGILEHGSIKRTRNKNIQKIILQTVAAAGVLSVAVLAPNALQMLKMFGGHKKPRQKEIIALSRKRLVNAGLLYYTDDGFLKLTTRGEVKLRRLERAEFKMKKPKRWDKKWRMIIFDIKEKRRLLREKLRHTIATIGFVRLQHSVWVYPYDCEDLITLLKADFKIGKDVLYLIVETIENDKSLKERFGLT